ncbi:MAG: preprotein translocase subunit YajC [Clostridia bacterium]
MFLEPILKEDIECLFYCPQMRRRPEAEPAVCLEMLAIYAVFIVILYFILIRPQRKRQKQTTAMQNAITNGDWVLLNDGMYGKVVNVVNECLMVEFGTSRSIIIPVRRDQILSAQEPDLTQKKIEDVEPEPQDDLVGEDLEEDGLDDYDRVSSGGS